MEKIFFWLIFFGSFLNCYSQNLVVDRFVMRPLNIDFKGHVQKIAIKDSKFETLKEKKDTVVTQSEFYFSKEGKLIQEKNFGKNLDDLTQIVDYSGIDKINTISRKKSDSFSVVLKQYFGEHSKYPDSIYIYRPEYSEVEKYINNFENNSLAKQSRFSNNKLVDYRIYKYDSNNRLIEELYKNPENESGEEVTSKEVNGTIRMSFYPQRQILYEYRVNNDTLIRIKIRPGKLVFKEVKKELKKKKYSLDIEEEYENEYLKRTAFLYKSKDSTASIITLYRGDKEISSCYKTFISPTKIISISKSDFYSNNMERKSTIEIKTVFDTHNNWIKKTYFKDKKAENVIERKIEYY